MRMVKITIDDSLQFSELKNALSLIRGISKIEVDGYSEETDKQEYEKMKGAFLNGSKRAMSHHISKFLQ